MTVFMLLPARSPLMETPETVSVIVNITITKDDSITFKESSTNVSTTRESTSNRCLTNVQRSKTQICSARSTIIVKDHNGILFPSPLGILCNKLCGQLDADAPPSKCDLFLIRTLCAQTVCITSRITKCSYDGQVISIT